MHSVEQPKETGLASTTWDPGLAPGTGNDDREKTGEIWTESAIQVISLHPCSLPLLTRILHVCKRIMLGEAGWRVCILSRQVLCKSKLIPKQTTYYVKGSACPSSVQFSSVAQSCSTLCDPMNCSTPGLPVHHQLPEFTQTHVHRVSDAIQPSHPLPSPSPPAPNPSQHHSLFQWVNSSHEVAKVLEFQLQHHSFQRNPRADLF